MNEYWIEDVQQDAILVFRDPAADTYKTPLMFRRGDSLSTLAFPGIHFKVEDILGPAV